MSDYNLAILILVIVILVVIIIVMAAQSMANGSSHPWFPRRYIQTPYYAHGGGPNTGMYY